MSSSVAKALPPGSTIGILGGGQLGRMLSQAAAQLGFDVCIFTDEPDSPAARVSAKAMVGNYLDHAALADFAKLGVKRETAVGAAFQALLGCPLLFSDASA